MRPIVCTQLDDFGDIYLRIREYVLQVTESCSDSFGNGLSCISGKENIFSGEVKKKSNGFGW